MAILKTQPLDTNNIQGISEIATHYDVYIFDLWGVIHDGVTPFPKTLQVMKNLKDLDKQIYLLSNSPRRSVQNAEHLASMGISTDLYNGAYTSGEDCHHCLKLRDNEWYQTLGKKLFHIGPERNISTFEGIGYTMVDSPFEAEFVLVTGTDGWFEDLSPYHDVLEECLMNGLPMVCANQDLIIHRQGRALICAGTIARRYEELGGEVFYHGKPSQEMYQRLCETYAIKEPKSKILMIGDSLLTDIPGALQYGIDALFIKDGIHINEGGNEQALFAKYGVVPTLSMQMCRW